MYVCVRNKYRATLYISIAQDCRFDLTHLNGGKNILGQEAEWLERPLIMF